MKDKINYKGKGEHSINELELIIAQREKEIIDLRFDAIDTSVELEFSKINYAGQEKIISSLIK